MYFIYKYDKYTIIFVYIILIFPNPIFTFSNRLEYRNIANNYNYIRHARSPLFDQFYNEDEDSNLNSIDEKISESDSIEWRNIVKNELSSSKTGTGIPVLSEESKKLLEDKIVQLRREANSDPGKHNYQPSRLWIIRPVKGPYCELMKKDGERIQDLVRNTRKYFTEDKLEIMDIKVDLDMPLCEIVFEGFINDIFRPFYARGTILQDEIVERFRVECPIIEKDIRLDTKYGGRYAPGLFPRWDTMGILEEIVDAMDRPPDWAAKFYPINFKKLLHFCRKFDMDRIEFVQDTFNWPTRQRVQRAFEDGVEDYRLIIQEEYERLQYEDRNEDSIPEWMPPMKELPK